MEILLAKPRGFCAGVDRAIEIVERALDMFGAPIYVRHAVVHNRRVVDDLRDKRAVFVEELDEVPDDRLAEVYDRFPILEERSGQRAGTLSGGQQQMLAMGRALMLDPDLLLLDEPSAGLAPDLVDDMFDRIDGINESGTAILMVEQNAKEALRRCNRGYVLVQGENRFEDSGAALLGDESVRQQFLGG